MPLLKLFTDIFKWDDSLIEYERENLGAWVHGGPTKKVNPLLPQNVVFEVK